MADDLRFDDLFREHYPRLVGLGVAMTGSEESARDLAQETMLRAHQRWDQVSGYEHPGGWLRRVMANLLIDQHRTSTAEGAAYGRLGRPRSASDDPDAVDHAAWEELIAPLSARQRAVVALHYGDDLRVEEVAELLGIPIGTVKSSLSRARDRVAVALTREDRHGQGA
jgi:RNA polymerase sigma-70 factor (ECF subfamily)